MKKCPLCRSEIEHNTCVNCGFAPIDENEINAIYSLEPPNNLHNSSVELHYQREITPVHLSEEIYPNRENTEVETYSQNDITCTRSEKTSTSRELSEINSNDSKFYIIVLIAVISLTLVVLILIYSEYNKTSEVAQLAQDIIISAESDLVVVSTDNNSSFLDKLMETTKSILPIGLSVVGVMTGVSAFKRILRNY